MSNVRANITVKGRVQGVGFRNWTYSQARLFGLTGWVKNAPESTVQICVEGAAEPLEEFLTALKVGPRLAKVTDLVISKEEIATQSYDQFSIVKE